MLFSLGNLFRAFVLGVLTLHVFVMYCLARTLGSEFGFSLSLLMQSAIFALIMLVPLLWAVTVPEWPEIFMCYFRRRRRWKRGRCPACNYDMQDNRRENESVCPECGGVYVEPQSYQFTWGIFKKFILINVLAWVIGVGGGEWWVLADEHDFREEAAAARVAGQGGLMRDRRWPCKGQLFWSSHGAASDRFWSDEVQ